MKPSLHFRSRSQEHLEAMVSVDKAARLQRLSLKRFQEESTNDLQLRRFLGHVSVNRRSTEIIRTATFEEDNMMEVEEQTVYDEDAEEYDVGLVRTTPDFDLASRNQPSESGVDDWTQLPMISDSIALAGNISVEDLIQYRPDHAELGCMTEDHQLLLNIDKDWMYDVLDLHIQESGAAAPLSRSVAIELWKMILQSLAKFATRDKWCLESTTHDIRQLEAHGLPQDDQLVGLGLLCNQRQYTQFNSQPQLMA